MDSNKPHMNDVNYYHESFENGINLLLEELRILYAFYSANHIVTDDFYTFRQTITKGIEGALISFTTDKNYEYYLHLLSQFRRGL